MNTHDKIELPPLPKPAMNEGDTTLYAAFAGSQLTAYARAAIEADRKQRSFTKPSTNQDWLSLDPAVAFHLIERHAENWNDAGAMMQAYLDAHIEADRKRRGEPTAAEISNVVREITGCPDIKSGEKSLVVSLGMLFHSCAAPQPTEPVKSYLTVKYDDKGDCLYVYCDSNEPAEAEENEQGVLLRRAFSDGRLVGVTILNFMGHYDEPVKVPSDDERAAQGLPPYNPRLPTDEEMKRLTENGRKAWGKDDTGPVRVPSDDDLLALIREHAFRQYEFDDLLAFARALLARYGNPSKSLAEIDASAQRVDPEWQDFPK